MHPHASRIQIIAADAQLVGGLWDVLEAAGIRAPVFGALARGILKGRASDALVHELMTGPIV